MDDHWNEAEEEKAPGLEIKDFLFAFARSRFWIFLLGGVGLLGGLIAAARMPNTYTSHAKLLLRVGAREELTPEELAGAETDKRSRAQTGPTIEDEIHLLTDEEIYKQLAMDYGPGEVVAVPNPQRLDEKDTPPYTRYYHQLQARLLGVGNDQASDVTVSRAAKALLSNTRIVTEPYSNVITVFHTSTSAKKAQDLCERITKAFIKRHHDQFSIAEYLPGYQEKVNTAGQELDAARTKYFAHLQECNLVKVEDDMSSLDAEKLQAEQDLSQAKMDLSGIAVKLEEKRKLLAEMSPVLIEVVPAVTRENEEWTGTLEAKRNLVTERARVPTDSNLTVEERRSLQAYYDTEIKALDEELKGLDRLIVEETEKEIEIPNEDYENLELEINNLDIDGKALATRKGELEQRIDELKSKKGDMLTCMVTHEKLQAKIDDKQQAFDKVSELFRKYSVLGAIDLEGDTNLQILKDASTPLNKNGPNRAKIALMGLFAGLMAGAGLAVLRQLLDSRLRYPHVVDRVLGIPVIGVVPDRRSVHGLLKKAPQPEATRAG